MGKEKEERERERDVWSVKSRGCAMGSGRLSAGRNVPSLPKQIKEKGLRLNSHLLVWVCGVVVGAVGEGGT